MQKPDYGPSFYLLYQQYASLIRRNAPLSRSLHLPLRKYLHFDPLLEDLQFHKHQADRVPKKLTK